MLKKEKKVMISEFGYLFSQAYHVNINLRKYLPISSNIMPYNTFTILIIL